MKQYYIYSLADHEGNVFYVGKGTKRRIVQHEIEADKGYGSGKDKHYICHCRKCLAIRRVWAAHHDVVKTVHFETDNEQRAYQYEKAIIAKYTSPMLCNVMHGPAKPSKIDHRIVFEYESEEYKEETGRRASGSGAVYQNSKGRWCSSIRYTDPTTGQKRRKKFEAKNREIVVNKLLIFTQESGLKIG